MSSRLMAAVAALVLVQPVAAQQAFEGVVKYRMTSEGRTVDVTYMTKGDRVRTEMEMEGMEVYMLIDAAAGTMATVMPEDRMVMRMNLNAQQGDQSANAEIEKVTATGRKETIAGHECEHYLMGEQQNIDVCVATGLGYYFGGGGGRGRRGAGPGGGMGLPSTMDPRARAFRERFKNGFFPLKLTMTERGRVQTEMVATSVERRRLADDLFQVPAGYQEMRMPAMPGMPGMGERP